MLVSSSFSNRTSYENQTKKAITNKICGAGHDRVPASIRSRSTSSSTPIEAEKACKQVLINKQSREHAEKARQHHQKDDDPADGPRQPRAEVR